MNGHKITLIVVAALVFVACSSKRPLTEAQYTQSIRKELPFAVCEFREVKPEVYYFRSDKYIDLLPDYEVDGDGAGMIWRTSFAATHDKQSAEYIWRNIVISKKNRRVVCIDRLLQDGKTVGYVYVLQSETKNCSNGYHCDVTDQRHLLHVAAILESQTGLSVELLKVLTP